MHKINISHVTGQELRKAEHLARLRLPLSRIQFYGLWCGMSVLAYVEEAMEESEGLLCLEPTWQRGGERM